MSIVKISEMTQVAELNSADALPVVNGGATKKTLLGGLADWVLKIYGGFLQAGTGAVSRNVQSKLRESVSVFDFMTASEIADAQSGSPVLDHTAAVSSAVAYCSSFKKLLVFPAGQFRLSTITVSDGILGIYCEGIIKAMGTAPVATLVLGSSGNPVKDAKFTLRMDQSGGDLWAVLGYDTVGCTFESCVINGFVNDPSLNHFAFRLEGPCTGNVFHGNHLTLFDTPTQRGFGIAFYGTATDDFGGFFLGSVIRASAPAIGNTISDNVITHGSYAVSIQAAEYNTITGNYCYNQNHRSVFLGNAAWGNTITGNVFRGFLSSAVLLSYVSCHNVVSSNLCEGGEPGAEAGINIQTGSRNNLIDGNKLICASNFGIYLGCDMVGNTVSNNDISNQYLAAIALENDWISPRPTNAFFSRTSYAAPPAPYTAWSTTNSSENTIKGNTIGAGYSGRNTAAIALAQIDAGGSTSLTNNNISDNHIVSEANIGYNLYFYADTPAKFTGAVVTGNNFHPGNIELSSTTTGATTWRDRIAYYADNREFDTVISGEVTQFTDGDTTPSVLTNSSVPTERIYSFTSYTSPTSVTAFDDGYDGQVITLRLSSQITIVYSAGAGGIRPKGLVNVSGGSTNNFIQFIRLAGIWLETSRSF